MQLHISLCVHEKDILSHITHYATNETSWNNALASHLLSQPNQPSLSTINDLTHIDLLQVVTVEKPVQIQHLSPYAAVPKQATINVCFIGFKPIRGTEFMCFHLKMAISPTPGGVCGATAVRFFLSRCMAS